mmetsp:Transcript_3776/g.11041  ORF Transcript_3776/g.11041 Transcript_3776/m.11041 type:complete len:330 (-) Transcript_3776:361-1350(-)
MPGQADRPQLAQQPQQLLIADGVPGEGGHVTGGQEGHDRLGLVLAENLGPLGHGPEASAVKEPHCARLLRRAPRLLRESGVHLQDLLEDIVQRDDAHVATGARGLARVLGVSDHRQVRPPLELGQQRDQRRGLAADKDLALLPMGPEGLQEVRHGPRGCRAVRASSAARGAGAGGGTQVPLLQHVLAVQDAFGLAAGGVHDGEPAEAGLHHLGHELVVQRPVELDAEGLLHGDHHLLHRARGEPQCPNEHLGLAGGEHAGLRSFLVLDQRLQLAAVQHVLALREQHVEDKGVGLGDGIEYDHGHLDDRSPHGSEQQAMTSADRLRQNLA